MKNFVKERDFCKNLKLLYELNLSGKTKVFIFFSFNSFTLFPQLTDLSSSSSVQTVSYKVSSMAMVYNLSLMYWPTWIGKLGKDISECFVLVYV